MSDFDDRYVAYREHAQAQQRTDSELSRLRERQATTEATLLHEVAAVRADVNEIKQMIIAQPRNVDHSALVQHRTLDTVVEALQQTRGNVSPALIALALIGSVALGALGMEMIVGN